MMRWLLRVLPDEADRRAAESDLAELYELRRRQDGDRAAARWLRRQHLLYPLHFFLDRARAAVSDWRALMRHLWRDVAYSLRSLARTPALTATIVLTVGIGLGATTAMVSVVRAVLVNPLPYAVPDQLARRFVGALRSRGSLAAARSLTPVSRVVVCEIRSRMPMCYASCWQVWGSGRWRWSLCWRLPHRPICPTAWS
jgi:hypothetical protein